MGYSSKGRTPQDPRNVPFQEIVPMKIRNKVSGKGGREKSSICLPEMQAILTCFKKYDFQQSRCLILIKTFQKCVDDTVSAMKVKKQNEESGVFSPNAKIIPYDFLNKYLKKFPIPKCRVQFWKQQK